MTVAISHPTSRGLSGPAALLVVLVVAATAVVGVSSLVGSSDGAVTTPLADAPSAAYEAAEVARLARSADSASAVATPLFDAPSAAYEAAEVARLARLAASTAAVAGVVGPLPIDLPGASGGGWVPAAKPAPPIELPGRSGAG